MSCALYALPVSGGRVLWWGDLGAGNGGGCRGAPRGTCGGGPSGLPKRGGLSLRRRATSGLCRLARNWLEAVSASGSLDESARIQIERHRRSLITVSATEALLSRAGRNDPLGFPPYRRCSSLTWSTLQRRAAIASEYVRRPRS